MPKLNRRAVQPCMRAEERLLAAGQAAAARREARERGTWGNFGFPTSWSEVEVHHDLPELLHFLTLGKKRKAAQTTTPGGYADGRRAFGTVGAAIVQVLSAGGEMKASEIHAAVGALLGGSVSHHSVGDFLRVRSRGSKALFERPRHGHYRLRAGRAAG